MEINQSIRRIREFKNFTQEYVAQQIGKSRKTYADIENGDVEPRTEIFENIANVLGVSVEDIVNFNNKNFLQSIFKDNSKNTGVVFSLKDEQSTFDFKKLYEKIIEEKDMRIKVLEDMIALLKRGKH